MADVPQPFVVNGDTYTVPGADTIEPLAASVTFDGTGAASSFLPCLSFYSQSGNLLSRTFPPGVQVLAGASAEVSYLPLGLSASSGSSASTWETLTAPELTLTHNDIEPFSFSHVSGSVLTDLTTPTAPSLLADGVYSLCVPVYGNYGGNITAFNWNLTLGQTPVVTDFAGTALGAPGLGAGFVASESLCFSGFLSAGQNLALFVGNEDPSNQLADTYHYDTLGLNIVKLP